MAKLHMLILLLGVLVSLAAAQAPVFCKCTCFKNSTIVPLDNISAGSDHGIRSSIYKPPFGFDFISSDDEAITAKSASDSSPLERRVPPPSCTRCTKAFCLNQGIDFCKTAKEDDVQTMCFQRDSEKDKIIIWAFILGTSGLLGWAAYRKYRETHLKAMGDAMPSRTDYSRIGGLSGERQ
ncbi:hypothetical protein CFIMG_005604RA [Ceratocystis fimbriata CBS 114723]|uniref:MFS transporter n=1 Tax=Ceratocystis fimbriata CBS 114723 TaxID=1035309 RepID=A0A2C5X402_9PEZI|nr:hypothetical protein CFIMG_005604RA [Ceratocystis fimbriata CBS 114723]